MRVVAVTVVSFFCVIAPAGPSSGAGTAAYAFLRLPVDARSAAMAGTGVALADGVSALHDNPAGLVSLRGRTLVTSYANHVLDIQSGFVGVVHPYRESEMLGVAATYLDWGEMVETDVAGTTIGEFGASDLAVGISYARSLSDGFSFGATCSFVYENIDEYSSTGLALDIGGLYRFPDGNVRIGAAARNLGFQLSGLTQSHKDPMPTEFVVGASAVPRGLPVRVALDVSRPLDDDFSARVGAEVFALDPVFLRVGYDLAMRDLHTCSTSDEFAGLSGGVGVRWREYSFDYAVTSYAALGMTHRLGVAWAF
jgi:hypothetical protein